MKNKIIMLLVIGSLLIPNYQASSNQQTLDNLTKEQQQLQEEIADKTEEITNAQIELNSLQTTTESNQQAIEELNQAAESKQQDIDNQMDNFKTTLSFMQKMNNQNAMLTYLTSDDDQNFFLKYRNVLQLSISIQDQIVSFSEDLKAINSDLAKAEAYKQQNEKYQTKQAELLAEQEAIEDELRAQLTEVDDEVLTVQTQISLAEAQAMQEAQNKATEEEIEKTEEDTADQVDKVTDETVDPAEPEQPVEPEKPVEPEQPETGGDSGYSDSGYVGDQKNKIMASAGIASSDYQYVDYIITKESGWNYLISNAYSGAYGLCQALPGSKMASAGSDWATNPETQMRWCNGYATSRYGSWQAAYNFWIENNWW